MIYNSAKNWQDAPNKRVMLFAMSGLGKTHISEMLRASGNWFHYSVDYRIGTRYMGEHITDNFKREAMNNPFLADLLRSDAIYIASNLRFHDLSPLSTYLGKPGDPAKGGIPLDEYIKRQRQHRTAEINAMKDTVHFIDRAQELYSYDHFVCDTSGSLVEVVDADDPNDPVMTLVSQHLLPVWIEGGEDHRDTLIERFSAAPKPMYYTEDFLLECWNGYLKDTGVAEDKVNPDDFIRWGYARLIDDRLPRYAKIAKRWGVTIGADDAAKLTSEGKFIAQIGTALEAL